MVIKELYLRNFRQIQEARIQFPERGLIGVVGPNGSGKTSILLGIAWLLYGSNVFPEAKLNIPRNDGDGTCNGELIFSAGGQDYKVVSSITGKNASIKSEISRWDGNSWTQEAAGADEVVERVERIVGLNWKAQKISLFGQQKSLNALAQLTNSERRTAIVGMLGLDRIDKAISAASKENNANKAAVAMLGEVNAEGLEMELVQTVAEIGTTSAIIASIEDEVKVQADALLQKEQQVKEHREWTQKTTLLNTEKDQLAFQLTQAPQPVDIDPIKTLIQTTEIALKDATAKRETAQKKEAIERQIELYRAKIVEIGELPKVEDLQARKAEVESALVVCEKQMAVIDTNIKDITQQSQDILPKMSECHANILIEQGKLKVMEWDSCPTCNQNISSELKQSVQAEVASRVDVLQKQYSALQVEQQEIAARLQEWVASKESHRIALDSYRTQLFALGIEIQDAETLALKQTENEQHEQSIATLRQQLEALPDTGDENWTVKEHGAMMLLAQHQEQLKQADETNRLYREWEEKADLWRARLSELETSILACGEEPVISPTIQTEIEGCRVQIEAKKASLQTQRQQLGVLTERQRQTEERIVAVKEELERRKEVYARIETLSTVEQELKGLRNDLISRIRPAIGFLAGRLISELTCGKITGIELGEDYDIRVSDHDGKEFSITHFSGGEEDLISLCLRYAVAQLLAGSHDSNFLVLDEPLAAQDSDRVVVLMSALQQLSQQHLGQIMFVTHVPESIDYTDRTIKVLSDVPGASTVEIK